MSPSWLTAASEQDKIRPILKRALLAESVCNKQKWEVVTQIGQKQYRLCNYLSCQRCSLTRQEYNFIFCVPPVRRMPLPLEDDHNLPEHFKQPQIALSKAWPLPSTGRRERDTDNAVKEQVDVLISPSNRRASCPQTPQSNPIDIYLINNDTNRQTV